MFEFTFKCHSSNRIYDKRNNNKNDNVIDYNKILNIDLACHVTANM